MADTEERVTALEAELVKLNGVIEKLTSRILVLESCDDGEETKVRTHTKGKGKDTSKKKGKKGGSKKNTKDKKASASKKNAKKASDEKKTRVKNQKTHSYHVVGKKMFVEVPEPFKFGTKHKHGPAKALALNYAYGYNGTIHGNLVVANDNEIVYALAGAAVAINPSDPTKQRFFTGHNEDVISIAKNPQCAQIATGQRDPKGEGTPYVCIFDCSLSEETLMPEKGRIVDFFERGVCSVGYTFDGKYLFAVGDDDAKTGGLFDMTSINENEGKVITISKPIADAGVAKDIVFGQAHAPDLIDEAYAWVTFGKKTINWWTGKPGAGKGEVLKKKILSSMQQTKITQKAYRCAAWTEDCNLLVGCSSGHIYMFNKSTKEITHWWDTGKSPIVSIKIGDEGQYRAMDARGQAYFYDSTKTSKHQHELIKSLSYKTHGKVTIAVDIGDSTYFGTEACNLVATDFTVPEPESKVLMPGFTKEIWALASHPSQNWVCIGCDDKSVRVWDYDGKRVILKKRGKHGYRTADFSRDGTLLALGTTSGAVVILDVTEGDDWGKEVYNQKCCGEEISAVAFSADGLTVIVGSWDQTLRLIEKKKDTWKLKKKPLKGHTSSITHICMSEDGKYARSNSKDVETLFWDVGSCKRVDYCDVNTIWDRWNCIFGWPVQGLFFEAGDPTDVNCCEISGGNENDDEGGKKVVASGDDTGHVTIFKYPILEEKPAYKDQYLVHSAHVTNVRWSEDDNWLFSVGGGDLACFQWAVTDK